MSFLFAHANFCKRPFTCLLYVTDKSMTDNLTEKKCKITWTHIEKKQSPEAVECLKVEIISALNRLTAMRAV